MDEQLNALKHYGLRCIRCSIIGNIFLMQTNALLKYSNEMNEMWMKCSPFGWSRFIKRSLPLFRLFFRVFFIFILLLSVSCDEPFISLYSAIIFLLQCIVIYFRRSPSRLSRFSFFFIQIYFLLYMLCDPVMWNNLSVLSSVRFFFPVLLVYLIVCVVFFLYRRQKYS